MYDPLSNQPAPDKQNYKLNLRTLRIVLVLTFIGSGYSFFNNLYMGLMLPLMSELYNSGTLIGPLAQMCAMFGADTDLIKSSIEISLAIPRIFYFIASVLYIMSFVGAIMMWRLRKTGFHFYALAQLLVLIVSMLFLDKSQVGIGDIMFTILFIVYYYITLRNLGVFSSTSEETIPSEKQFDENNDNENNNSNNNNLEE